MHVNFIEKLLLRAPFWIRFIVKHDAKRVLAQVPCLEDCACLEIGGGYGVGALLIKHYTGCDHIYSVDVDPDMVAKAKRFIAKPHDWAVHIPRPGIEFFEGDARELPFEDEVFQAAFHFYVLDHIPKWEKAIHEVARTLKPGGVYSFADALFPEALFLFNGLFGHVSIKRKRLIQALEDAGFQIEQMETRGRFIKRIYVHARKTAAIGRHAHMMAD